MDLNTNPKKIFSNLLFFWVLPYFYKGIRKILNWTDLESLKHNGKSGKIAHRFIMYWNEEIRDCKPNLKRAIFNCFRSLTILSTFFAFVNECVLRILQPVILCFIMEYFTLNEKGVTKFYTFFLIMLFLFISYIIIKHYTNYLNNLASIQLKIGLYSLIHKKCMKLSVSNFNEDFSSNTYRLSLNNNNKTIDHFFSNYQNVFIIPIQSLIIVVTLWYYLGSVLIFGLGIFILLSFTIVTLTSKISPINLKKIILSDERISLSKYIIRYLNVIKINVWQAFFIKNISFLRKQEIGHTALIFQYKSIITIIQLISDKIALLGILYFMRNSDNDINSTKIFVTIYFLEILKEGLIFKFPTVYKDICGSNVLIRHFEKFLNLEETNKPYRAKLISIELSNNEIDDSEKYLTATNDGDETTVPFLKENNVMELKLNKITEASDEESSTEHITTEQIRMTKDSNFSINEQFIVSLKNVHVEDSFSKNVILNDISMNISSGKCVGIVGSAKSGKTSLLLTLLKELSISDGFLSVYGKISYSPKFNNLFEDTIQNNVVFYTSMDIEKYNNITKQLGLVQILEYEKNTLLLQKDHNYLSEYHRRLINIARTIYQDSDIYLFDEPFCDCGDKKIKTCLSKSIVELLQSKTIILTSTDIEDVKNADEIYIMKDGSIVANGTYNEIMKLNIVDESIDKNEDESNLLFNEGLQHLRERTTNAKKEQQTVYSSENNFKNYIFYNKSYIWLFIALLCLIISQILITLSEFWIGKWLNKNKTCETMLYPISFDNINNENGIKSVIHLNNNETEAQVNVSTSDPTFYDSNISLYNLSNTSDVLYTTNMFCKENTFELFLKYYAGIIFLILLILIPMYRIVNYATRNIASQLHNKLINNILYAKLFFVFKIYLSSLYKCFSKEVQCLDLLLPIDMIESVQLILKIIGIYFVISYLNNWLLIPIVFIIGFTYGLHLYYIPLSRSLNILNDEAITKMKTSIWNTLNNIIIIRTLECQESNKLDLENQLDSYYSVKFLIEGVNGGLNVWLDFLNVILLMCALLGFITTKDMSIAYIGLIFTQIVMANLSKPFFKLASFKNDLVSVERILKNTNIEQEQTMFDIKSKKDKKDSPENGEIIFKNVWLRYSPMGKPIIQNINFVIKQQEKIAICGKPFSGKSSIYNALLRLNFIDGKILIDRIDSKNIELDLLRSKVSYISQDPLMLTETLRRNLDINDKYPEETIWDALDQVNLKDDVSNLKNELNTIVSEMEYKFSQDQKYLLCLARAIITQNKILIFDDVFDVVNKRTREAIKKAISNRLANSTVLITTRDLDSIIECDKVMILEKGNIIEFDNPRMLLKNPSSALSTMFK